MGDASLYFSILGALTAIFGVITGILAVIIAWLNYRLHKRRTIEKVLTEPLRTAEMFYEACEQLHKKFSHVKILSKTPGLLLPSEKNAASFRIDYFETIFSKLKKGKYEYQLHYLFDTEGFITTIKSYQTNQKFYNKQLQTVKKMLKRALEYENLDLRTTYTGMTIGLVIGGNETAIVGFKDPSVSNITEGMLIKASELVTMFSILYDSLFQRATKVDIDYIDALIEKKSI